MDPIQHRSKRLCRRSQTQPTTPESLPLVNLPLEILFHTLSYLPLESMGCLGLTCQGLHLRLTKEYVQRLKVADPSVLKTFLQLLERDLPQHIICPTCNKLHSTALAERHVVKELYHHPSSQKWSKCGGKDSQAQIARTMTPGFSTTIFLMAMKAFRQGQDPRSLLHLLSYKKTVTLPGFAQLTMADARICNGSLLVRDQTVFMLPSPQMTPTLLSGEFQAKFGYCRHSMIDKRSDLAWCGITVPEAKEIDQYTNKEGIIYCRYCYTELRIDFKSIGKDCNAMFVTRWMDVGDGRDEKDPKWEGRWSDEWLFNAAMYPRGSISSAFEGTENFQFDSLLTKEDEVDLWMKCPFEGAGEGNGQKKKAEPRFMVRDGRVNPILLYGEESRLFCE